MRISKFIAHSGYCSRRDAEKLIYEKKITINDLVCKTPAINVTEKDIIKINNKKINLLKKKRIWSFYKPVGFITTKNDPQGRKTVFDIIPKNLSGLITIGRLDINSEGLLLLTNNGDLARYFELPKNKIKRSYRVRIRGSVDKKNLSYLKKGLVIDGFKYKGIIAVLNKQMGANAWITMTLTEGKNREIRKICRHFGWQVNKLIREGYGDFSLGMLKPGNIREETNHNYHNVLI